MAARFDPELAFSRRPGLLEKKKHKHFTSDKYFFHFPSTRVPPVRPFLPNISPPTGFHDEALVTRWAQLLITSNYYLPSPPKRSKYNEGRAPVASYIKQLLLTANMLGNVALAAFRTIFFHFTTQMTPLCALLQYLKTSDIDSRA